MAIVSCTRSHGRSLALLQAAQRTGALQRGLSLCPTLLMKMLMKTQS